MDQELIKDLALLVTGGAGTLVGGFLQQRWSAKERRQEREAVAAADRQKRHSEVHAAEFEHARNACRRAIQIGREYRAFSPGGEWRAFEARFIEVSAELDLFASQQVREAFERYIDRIQEAEFNARSEPPEEYWIPIDEASKELAQVARDFLRNFQIGQA